MEVQKDHTHDLYVSGSGDKAVYTLGPPEGQLQARVPIYGKLSFRDKTGTDEGERHQRGRRVDLSQFHRGRTAAAAIWTFDGLSEDLFPESKFPNGIPVEMTIEVFRTHKGNQEKGVAGTISLENPKTGKQVLLRNFLAKKFATDVQMIPRSFITAGSDGTSGNDRSVPRPGQRRRPSGDHPAMPGTAAVLTAWPRPTCTSAPPTARLPGTSARATWESGCKWPWSSAWA